VWLAVRRQSPREASLGPSRTRESRGLRTNHPPPTPALLNSTVDDNTSGQSRYTRAASSSWIFRFLFRGLVHTCMLSVVVVVLFVMLQTNTPVVPCRALL
jgi:hypothetical protein